MTDNSEGKPSRYFRIIPGLYELTSLWSTDLSTVLTDLYLTFDIGFWYKALYEICTCTNHPTVYLQPGTY